MWTETLKLDASGAIIDGGELKDRSPDLILVFAQADQFMAKMGPVALKVAFPGAHVLGCSTGTTVSNQGLSDDAMSAVAVGFEHTRLRSVAVPLDFGRSCEAVGVRLGEQLADPELSAVFILCEGLDINASALVAGLTQAVGDRVQISGGLAGDGPRFTATCVLHDGEPCARMVTALGFYGGALRIGYGSDGGWDEFGPVRTITKSEGNVLFELDDKPALDLYERYLGEEAADLPASGLFYPLKIYNPARPDEKMVRTILGIDREARSMTFAGDIPKGWKARLMQGEFENLIYGAQTAANLALKSLQKGDVSIVPQLSMLVSCVGRRLLMGQRTSDEVRAVSQILGSQATQIGFYSYGEISPHPRSKISALHNQTMTLTLLAEVA